MSFARTARPLARALCSSPLATARFSSRPSLLAARNITPVATQLPLKAPRIETEGKPAALAAGKKKAGKGSPETKALLMAAMPQMVPFYWVGETFTAFFVITALTYMSAKYFLPQTVRTRLARLFITKL